MADPAFWQRCELRAQLDGTKCRQEHRARAGLWGRQSVSFVMRVKLDDEDIARRLPAGDAASSPITSWPAT